MKQFLILVLLCFFGISCSNKEVEPNQNLVGGACTYREQAAVYTVDSLIFINDTIMEVIFISDSINSNNKPLKTILQRNTLLGELYNDSILGDLNLVLNQNAMFFIKERFIENGTCSPYSLDEFEVLK